MCTQWPWNFNYYAISIHFQLIFSAWRTVKPHNESYLMLLLTYHISEEFGIKTLNPVQDIAMFPFLIDSVFCGTWYHEGNVGPPGTGGNVYL